MQPQSHGFVTKYFQERGWKVHGQRKDGQAKGIDLMLTKGDEFASVEVKAIRHDGKSFRFDLLPTQYDVDLLALVTKRGAVMVLPMALFQKSERRRSISLGSLVGEL